jgi:hypothetical protein
MAQAAVAYQKRPRQLSFKGTLQTITAFLVPFVSETLWNDQGEASFRPQPRLTKRARRASVVINQRVNDCERPPHKQDPAQDGRRPRF